MINGTLFRMLFAVGASLVVMAGVISCDKSPSEPAANLQNLRITEIHYNPADTAEFISDSLEFLELKNVGTTTIDLGSLGFTAGIDYTFPVDASLDAGGFYLLASSQNAFKKRYGFSPDGVYSGLLKNSDETLELTDFLSEKVVFTQEYSDSNGWVVEPDGDGYSLVPVDYSKQSSSDPADWRRSARINGSPGKDENFLAVDSLLFALRITEIHYHPLDPDTFGGDSLEFIELKNCGTSTISLERLIFTRGIVYTFPAGSKLEPGAFFTLASNKNVFQDRYKKLPTAVYTGQLSNSGEMLQLEDIGAGITIFKVSYADVMPWPSLADGNGYSLVPYLKNPPRDQNNPSTWRHSARLHGSPGSDEQGVVVVNEILSNPRSGQVDAVELYNPGDEKVNISGWFLTDSKSQPVKYEIPDGTELAPASYVVFTEDDFTKNQDTTRHFSLGADGDDIFIVADSSGCSGESYCHGFSFGALEMGVGFGRLITQSGGESFAALSGTTLGSKNSEPLIGPLVISEIMYHSSDNKGDFIEITNVSLQEVRLYDPDKPDVTWKIGGTAFSFPKNSTIASGKSIVIASDSISIDAFRQRYGLDDDVVVYQMNGSLVDDKPDILLLKPEAALSSSTAEAVPFLLVDNVTFSNKAPWPQGAHATGESVHRNSKSSFGNDPASWISAPPTPGTFE